MSALVASDHVSPDHYKKMFTCHGEGHEVPARARVARARALTTAAFVCRRLLLFGLFQFAVALLLHTRPLLTLTALQPMRWMHLFFLLFFLLSGCMIGEFLLATACGAGWRYSFHCMRECSTSSGSFFLIAPTLS